MTPQSNRFLEKAHKLLTEGDTMLSVALYGAVGRTAYLAGFHAAQALIFERLGKVVKTHHGVQTEFLRLTKDEESVDRELRAFLSRAYNLKAIADYDTGPGSDVSPERATEAMSTGKLFVAHVARLIGASEAAH